MWPYIAPHQIRELYSANRANRRAVFVDAGEYSSLFAESTIRRNNAFLKLIALFYDIKHSLLVFTKKLTKKKGIVKKCMIPLGKTYFKMMLDFLDLIFEFLFIDAFGNLQLEELSYFNVSI